MPVPRAPQLRLADDEQRQLESIVHAHSTLQALLEPATRPGKSARLPHQSQNFLLAHAVTRSPPALSSAAIPNRRVTHHLATSGVSPICETDVVRSPYPALLRERCPSGLEH